MKLYLVEYDNGMDYEDHYTCVVGVYSSEKLAEQAGEDSIRNKSYSANYMITKIDLDEYLFNL